MFVLHLRVITLSILVPLKSGLSKTLTRSNRDDINSLTEIKKRPETDRFIRCDSSRNGRSNAALVNTYCTAGSRLD